MATRYPKSFVSVAGAIEFVIKDLELVIHSNSDNKCFCTNELVIHLSDL